MDTFAGGGRSFVITALLHPRVELQEQGTVGRAKSASGVRVGGVEVAAS